jgi:adenylate cyclase
MADVPPAQTPLRAVLVVDIVSSTRLYEVHGNIAAQQMVESCLRVLSTAVEAHKGQVIKSLGDGLLCSFASQEDSVWAAVAMCDGISEHELEVRVGVHCGEVVEDRGDIFGDAVNTASRIVGVAKPAEILITATLRDALPPFMQGIVRAVQPVSVKGKRDPIELYAILKSDNGGGGDDISQTICMTREETSSAPADGHLELSYQGQKLSVGPGEDVTIGREAGNELVISSKHVSRLHARVFSRGGKFHVEDKSANGTFLVPDHQAKLRIFREDAMLYGGGLIYLGADPDRTPSDPVRNELGLGALARDSPRRCGESRARVPYPNSSV